MGVSRTALPWLKALVLSAATSEPPSGSVTAIAVRVSPETMPGMYLSRCSSLP